MIQPRVLGFLGLASLLGACGSDIKVTKDAICDGVAEASEETVDASFDRDGDGFFDGTNPGCQATYAAADLDCDDGDPDIHPGAAEVSCDGIDNDCDPSTPDSADDDGDSYTTCEDCDDSDATVNPGASEIECDGIDNDCDASTLDGVDADADGYPACDECDDNNPDANPAETEIECNDVDDDCDPETPDGVDNDGDGYTACDDCDDTDATVNPGADEVCDDGIDNDCDGDIDEDCTTDYTDTWTLDDRVHYSCAFGAVTINFNEVLIIDDNPDITVASTGTGSQPGTMEGSFTSATAWSVARVLTGGCTETYAMDGVFTDDNTFTATFTASYSGGAAQCLDCSTQTWDVTGTR